MITVAMLNTERNRGGAAIMASNLTRTLNSHCSDLKVTLFHSGDKRKDPPFYGLKKPLARYINVVLARLGCSIWVIDMGFARHMIELTRNSDILHLHNLHGYYLNYPKLLQAWKNRPIVWTWHDMWGVTGRCGSSSDCSNWRFGCLECPHKDYYPAAWIDRAAAEFKIKKKLFGGLRNLTVVTPSQWLADIAYAKGFKRDRVHIIPNPVTAAFKPFDKTKARNILHLSQDRFIALFIASDCGDPRKGYADFALAVEAIGCLGIAVGKAPPKKTCNIKHAGCIADQKLINYYYCAADVMLIPTYADNYPNTVVEALISGTPVIGYNEGGIPSQLDLPHCRVIEKANYQALAEAMRSVADIGGKSSYMVDELSNLAQSRWNPSTAAERYRRLYQAVFDQAI